MHTPRPVLMSSSCATGICHSDCRTQSRCQEDTQQEHRDVLCCPFLALKTSRELKGCLLVCGSPELRARAAGTTAPRSKTSKGALGLEKDIKNSELFILGYKNNTAQIPPLPLQFRPALWGG